MIDIVFRIQILLGDNFSVNGIQFHKAKITELPICCKWLISINWKLTEKPAIPWKYPMAQKYNFNAIV